jgi:hypothetical protein
MTGNASASQKLNRIFRIARRLTETCRATSNCHPVGNFTTKGDNLRKDILNLPRGLL